MIARRAPGTWIELNCRHHADGHGLALVASRARQGREVRDQSPDAHRISQFAMLRHGVTLARKGWLRREDVMNTMKLEAIRKALGKT